MINIDSALRLHLKAVQGLGIDGDSMKRLTNIVERRLEFLENEVSVFTGITVTPDERACSSAPKAWH